MKKLKGGLVYLKNSENSLILQCNISKKLFARGGLLILKDKS